MPEPKASASAAARDKKKKGRLELNAGAPRISAETMRRFRVETCYFGSFGMRLARDAYLASLGGAEPSATKLPAFGDYPENKTASPAAPPIAPHETVAAGRPPALLAQQLPFVRHVRSCSIAKGQKASADAAFDKALADFDAYAGALNRDLLDATRYYAQKRYEKDEMKRGKELHTAMVKGFPELDGKLVAFGTALDAWLAAAPAPTEKVDKGGELSTAALTEARALARLLLAPEVDAGAVKEAIDKTKKALEPLAALAKEDQKSPHARSVPPKLEALIAAAEQAHKDLKAKKLPVADVYAVSAAMATLLEAQHQSLGQLLRQQGGRPKGNPPMRLMNPRVTPPGGSPRVRPPGPGGEPDGPGGPGEQ